MTAGVFLTLSLLPACYPLFANDPNFGERQDLGLIEHDAISEASGLAASHLNADVLWTHNDRGGEAAIYAFRTDGVHLGVFRLHGVSARDWEDMAVGPGPQPGMSYLYIGDIGDNDGSQDFKFIYRVPEPVVAASQAPVDTVLADFERIIVQYPDGNRDAETLMLDSPSRDLYIVSKPDSVRVYRLAYPQSTTQIVVAELGTILSLKNREQGFETVAGDISPSGAEILLKTYADIFYWCRSPQQSVLEALSERPAVVPYVREPRGEAVAWSGDSLGYYTVSEEADEIAARLYFYARKQSTGIQSRPQAQAFVLLQNYPNPFNPETTISFALNTRSHVNLTIYDVRGRPAAGLIDATLAAGPHQIKWQATGHASGLYFCRLQAGGQSRTRKLILVR